MTHTIIFKILESEPRYSSDTIKFLDINTQTYIDLSNIDITNWDTDDIIQLNNKFTKLVKNNYDEFIYYKNYCKTITSSIYNRIVKYNIKKKCDKFNRALDAYEDVFNRDLSAFYQEKKGGDVDINVCILFDNSYNYLGHIYCWIVNNMCIGFGIRSKIGNFFNKPQIKISLHLLEGLRKFAIANKCKHKFIPDPLPNMEKILLDNNFVYYRPYEYAVRNQFMGYLSLIKTTDYHRNYMYPSVPGFIYNNLSLSFISQYEAENYGFKIITNQTAGKKIKNSKKQSKTKLNKTIKKLKTI